MNFLQKTTELGSKQRLWFLGFAALLAVAYDILFWDKSLGINFAIFVVVYLVGFLTLCYKYSLFAQKKALFLLAPILVMTVDTQLYSNTMVHYWVPLFILVQLFVLTGWLPAKNPQGVLFAIRRIPLIRHFDLAIAQWGSIIRDLSADNGTSSRAVARRIFIGVALALPILFFFGALFYSADQVFAGWIDKIDVEMVDLWRVIRTIGLSLLIGGIFYEVAKTGYEFTQNTTQRETKESDPIIVSVILVLINILFGVFVFIQFKYLFGSATFVTENELTYAEYARKGFFELLVVSGLATIIAQAVYRGYKSLRATPVLYITALLLLVQTGIIAASAFTRLNLYQDVYGFTVLRLYTEWFILFLFGIFAVIGYGIISNMEFRKNFLVLWGYGLISLTIVVSMNVDGIIAQKNIDRFVLKLNTESSAEITTEVTFDIFDSGYIARLSADVVPSLVDLTHQTDMFTRIPMYQQDEIIAAIHFDSDLNGGADTNKIINSPDWQEYHAGREYLYATYVKEKITHTDKQYQFSLIERHLTDYMWADSYVGGSFESCDYLTFNTINAQPFFPVVTESMMGCHMMTEFASTKGSPVLLHTYSPESFITLELFTKDIHSNQIEPKRITSVSVPNYTGERPEVLLRGHDVFVLYRSEKRVLQYTVLSTDETNSTLYIQGPKEIQSTSDILL